jgi:Flp pilus assembly protein TadB
MLDAPSLPRAANGAADRDGATRGFRLPGLAAVVWLIGLVLGLLALIAGDAGVAIVALVGAVVAPWVGIGWISRSRREVHNDQDF